MQDNKFGCLKELDSNQKYFSLEELEKKGFGNLDRLPMTIKILLEQALRNYDDFEVKEKDIQNLASWKAKDENRSEIPFKPTRVVLQDFTGVPAVVDLASLRSSMQAQNGDPKIINPKIPVDLVIDHSVQVDHYGGQDSLEKNMEIEFQRNRERYEFLKWGQQAFQNFRVFPPGVGIVHQVNLEFLAQVVQSRNGVCFPDTLVGTDSHTTMINGLGVIGWGVGGIEAESVMLGQPIYMLSPQVVGFKLTNELTEGTTATDLVLKVVEILRQKGVVEKFVEFYGPGLRNLSLADRATISNMAPEYGATLGFFPVDSATLGYLKRTGRSDEIVQRVEAYSKAQGLFRTDETPEAEYSDYVELDLSEVEPALAGPKRPQDRVSLKNMKSEWKKTLEAPIEKRGFALSEADQKKTSSVQGKYDLKQGSVVIAAITSCTNTSNPSVMIAAGILAKKAVEKGLQVKPWVKTSLAPGSRVVTDYLDQSKLTEYLQKLGFYTVGYGCTTCIGNSGPINDEIVEAINNEDLVVASVLSGNRNFEGRISPHVKANYLASPPLVVAYALAGNVEMDLENEALGKDQDGNDVFLKDIWPTKDEIILAEGNITSQMYQGRYQAFEKISEVWNKIEAKEGDVYDWDEGSTYVQNPPFFQGMSKNLDDIKDITGAKALVKVADSVTTDHISPAGAFSEDSPAGKYLVSKGVTKKDFNSYGSRRGNDRIMTRGTFGNVRLRNQLAPGTEGGFTKYFPEDEVTTIFEAAEKYKESATPLIVLAGKEYGTGSSRDWAAKGTYLLGVKAVIASSYERIHRSNLLGMGVLPLQFKDGDSHESLGIQGDEEFAILGLSNDLKPLQDLTLKVNDKEIQVTCRLDTDVEIQYYRNGGVLHNVLRKELNKIA